MKDPESARFEWPYEFTPNKSGADWTCARVNAKNSYGGYTGFKWISVVVKDGRVTRAVSDELEPWIRRSCDEAGRKGRLAYAQ